MRWPIDAPAHTPVVDAWLQMVCHFQKPVAKFVTQYRHFTVHNAVDPQADLFVTHT